MINVALYHPEIPSNTGNIIRLCANTGSTLHLIHPLGFQLNEKKVRRAGLDYHDLTCIKEYKSYQDFLIAMREHRIVPCSTKGKCQYNNFIFKENDVLLLGPETRGLSLEILQTFEPKNIVRIPMRENNRSLNLSNAVAIIVYEAWRQFNFSNTD